MNRDIGDRLRIRSEIGGTRVWLVLKRLHTELWFWRIIKVKEISWVGGPRVYFIYPRVVLSSH